MAADSTTDGTFVLDPERSGHARPGDKIATDVITDSDSVVTTGQKVQRIKAGFGADGEYADVTEDAPLPITSLQLRHNESMERLLEDILTETKITNLHLSLITGEDYTEDDVAGNVGE